MTTQALTKGNHKVVLVIDAEHNRHSPKPPLSSIPEREKLSLTGIYRSAAYTHLTRYVNASMLANARTTTDSHLAGPAYIHTILSILRCFSHLL